MPNPTPASSPSPLTPPAPSAATRRRRRRQLLPCSPAAPTSASTSSSSSSSTSASSAVSFSFPSFSPAPSPFHSRFLSPLRSSSVPFSWEHRPGIPKTPARQARSTGSNSKHAAGAKTAPLPLPPSLLSSKVRSVDDPFVSNTGYFIVAEDAKAARRRQRRERQRRSPALAATLTDWLAVLSLYRSCSRSRDCLATGTPPQPRPRATPTKAAGRSS